MTTASLIRRSASTPTATNHAWGRFGFAWPELTPFDGRGRAWNESFATTPPADMWHSEDAYFIEVDLPGLGKDDVEVSVENNVLTISGGRPLDESHAYDRAERWHGRFTRSFVLSNRVDAEKVRAQFENGVLRLELPRSEATKPRRVAIH